MRPAHLLAALLGQADGVTAPLLRAVGVDPEGLRSEVDASLRRLPTAAGSTVSAPQLDRAALRALSTAQQPAGEIGDEYVSTEHLLVGLATGDDETARLLTGRGATPAALREGFAAVRGCGCWSTAAPSGGRVRPMRTRRSISAGVPRRGSRSRSRRTT